MKYMFPNSEVTQVTDADKQCLLWGSPGDSYNLPSVGGSYSQQLPRTKLTEAIVSH